MQPPAQSRRGLTDGEWHRLHPATPLLRGGIWLLAVIGFLVANFRERLIGALLPDEPGAPPDAPDIIGRLYERGHLFYAIAIVVGVLVVAVVGFWLSWRMHSFRITHDAVQVRSGILFRTRRDARLDRVQGITLTRPLLARIFGAAKLDISVAGQDAKVQLAYVRDADADRLRREILALASGVRPLSGASTTAAREGANVSGQERKDEPSVTGVVTRRVSDLLSSDLTDEEARTASVVRIPPGRLIGSLLASGFSLVVIGAGVAIFVSTVLLGNTVVLFAIVPGLLASLAYYFSRFFRTMRFTIVGTADGIRVGQGLLSTTSDTLPPGRVHAIEVSQPLLWRPFQWWQMRVNRAGHPGAGAGMITATTVLPVGKLDDVVSVLSLLVTSDADGDDMRSGDDGRGTSAEPAAPERSVSRADHAQNPLVSVVPRALLDRDVSGFQSAPSRARLVLPFSWHRTGVRFVGTSVVFRAGALWRRVTVIPLARMQSAELRQGPLRRALRLAALKVHTVQGPVFTGLPALDDQTAESVWTEIAQRATAAALTDRTHRWAENPGAHRERGTAQSAEGETGARHVADTKEDHSDVE